ncbi:hypothetical protein LTS18_012990, partial [Coniosporium uncinatum]
ILSRTGGKRGLIPYETNALKDVVLLGEGETVKVIARYSPWDGVYMFHWQVKPPAPAQYSLIGTSHNLVHEDHDMMAAFNVTQVADFGYGPETKFIDPMEERWRSKPYPPSESVEDKLKLFAGLDAYAHEEQVEAALVDYWKTATATTLITSTKASSSASAAVPSATALVSTTSSVRATSSTTTSLTKTTSTKISSTKTMSTRASSARATTTRR